MKNINLLPMIYRNCPSVYISHNLLLAWYINIIYKTSFFFDFISLYSISVERYVKFNGLLSMALCEYFNFIYVANENNML